MNKFEFCLPEILCSLWWWLGIFGIRPILAFPIPQFPIGPVSNWAYFPLIKLEEFEKGNWIELFWWTTKNPEFLDWRGKQNEKTNGQKSGQNIKDRQIQTCKTMGRIIHKDKWEGNVGKNCRKWCANSLRKLEEERREWNENEANIYLFHPTPFFGQTMNAFFAEIHCAFPPLDSRLGQQPRGSTNWAMLEANRIEG